MHMCSFQGIDKQGISEGTFRRKRQGILQKGHSIKNGWNVCHNINIPQIVSKIFLSEQGTTCGLWRYSMLLNYS